MTNLPVYDLVLARSDDRLGQEQSGFKLEPSKAERGTLAVDRLERPTEN